MSYHATPFTWFGSKSATLFAAAAIKKVLSLSKKSALLRGEGGERPKIVQRIKCTGGVTQSGGVCTLLHLDANWQHPLMKLKKIHLTDFEKYYQQNKTNTFYRFKEIQ